MTPKIKARLEYLRGEIEKESISYGEIAELQDYRKEILELGDIELAQWSGLTEEEWNNQKLHD